MVTEILHRKSMPKGAKKNMRKTMKKFEMFYYDCFQLKSGKNIKFNANSRNFFIFKFTKYSDRLWLIFSVLKKGCFFIMIA